MHKEVIYEEKYMGISRNERGTSCEIFLICCLEKFLFYLYHIVLFLLLRVL